MRIEQSNSPPVSPILFRAKTMRIAGPELPGNYDPSLSVWVVVADGVRQPIIAAAADSLVNIRTFTKVNSEVDDEQVFADRSYNLLTEIETKTETQREADDEDITVAQRLGLLAEVVTKTAVQSEADDEGGTRGLSEGFPEVYWLPELRTKTDVQRERDDETESAGLELKVGPSACDRKL